MEISEKNKERARLLHTEALAADLHADLPGELLFWHRAGKQNILKEYYLPAWKTAGIALVGAAVYIEEECLPDGAFENAMQQIAALLAEIRAAEDEVCLIRSRRDLDCAYRKEKIGILLYMEGLDFAEEDDFLEQLYALGVRGAALTWSRKNALASGCCRADENRRVHGGISQKGWQVLNTMREMGMFLDISHLNDDGIRELLADTDTKRKILATHSNARFVCPHYRNLTRKQLGLLRKRGGVVGLNACTLLSGSCHSGEHFKMLQKQTLGLLACAGETNVCLGLDLCNRYDRAQAAYQKKETDAETHDALSGYEQLWLLSAALLEAGLSEKTAAGVLGENAFAFFRSVFTE